MKKAEGQSYWGNHPDRSVGSGALAVHHDELDKFRNRGKGTGGPADVKAWWDWLEEQLKSKKDRLPRFLLDPRTLDRGMFELIGPARPPTKDPWEAVESDEKPDVKRNREHVEDNHARFVEGEMAGRAATRWNG